MLHSFLKLTELWLAKILELFKVFRYSALELLDLAKAVETVPRWLHWMLQLIDESRVHRYSTFHKLLVDKGHPWLGGRRVKTALFQNLTIREPMRQYVEHFADVLPCARDTHSVLDPVQHPRVLVDRLNDLVQAVGQHFMVEICLDQVMWVDFARDVEHLLFHVGLAGDFVVMLVVLCLGLEAEWRFLVGHD
jgi:hypothetical protein